MYNYFTELMLNEYFTAVSVFGKFSSESEKLFSALCKIFLIPSKDAEKLFKDICSEEVSEIVTDKDYMQYKRIKSYALLTGLNLGDSYDGLIDIKGNAILNACKGGLVQEGTPSIAAATRLLTDAADSGLILAMNILGVLQSEGIILDKDVSAGYKTLLKSAMWNSEEGLISALYYGKDRRAEFMNQMRYNLCRSSKKEAYAALEKAYGKFEGKPNRTFGLLHKAMETGILKREMYSRQYARILFSDLLPFMDKEALFFTPNKELFADAANLPLKLSSERPIEYDAAALGGSLVIRDADRPAFLRMLDNSDLRALSAYRPPCVISDSDYLLENSADRLSRCFNNAHIERIEVADLTEYDLEPTKNHIFVRNCDEDSANIYMIFFRGNIPDRVFDLVKTFLQTEKRKKFRLNHPGVYLNLSPIMPVCFADRENSNKLRELCEFVPISGYSAEEKEKISHEIFTDKRSLYGAVWLDVPSSFYSRLSAYTIDEIARIVDDVVRDNRKSDGSSLTEAHLAQYFKAQLNNRKTFGFGGGAHEGD